MVWRTRVVVMLVGTAADEPPDGPCGCLREHRSAAVSYSSWGTRIRVADVHFTGPVAVVGDVVFANCRFGG